MRMQASGQKGLAIWGLVLATLLVGFTTVAAMTIATWSTAAQAGLY
jgi:hypothetical protein